MSTKEIVQDLLQKLPENVSLHEVAREIEFVAAVRQGLAEIDRGERIPIEEVERELPAANSPSARHPLRGKPVTLRDPMEPAANGDWASA